MEWLSDAAFCINMQDKDYKMCTNADEKIFFFSAIREYLLPVQFYVIVTHVALLPNMFIHFLCGNTFHHPYIQNVITAICCFARCVVQSNCLRTFLYCHYSYPDWRVSWTGYWLWISFFFVTESFASMVHNCTGWRKEIYCTDRNEGRWTHSTKSDRAAVQHCCSVCPLIPPAIQNGFKPMFLYRMGKQLDFANAIWHQLLIVDL